MLLKGKQISRGWYLLGVFLSLRVRDRPRGVVLLFSDEKTFVDAWSDDAILENEKLSNPVPQVIPVIWSFKAVGNCTDLELRKNRRNSSMVRCCGGIVYVIKKACADMNAYLRLISWLPIPSASCYHGQPQSTNENATDWKTCDATDWELRRHDCRF